MRTSQTRQSNNELDDGVAHGWPGWLRRRSVDSFFSRGRSRRYKLDTCIERPSCGRNRLDWQRRWKEYLLRSAAMAEGRRRARGQCSACAGCQPRRRPQHRSSSRI